MGKMTEEQKAAIATAVVEAVESGDHGRLGNAVAAAIVANNPKYGPWGALLGATIGAAIRRFSTDYGSDADGVKAPLWRRLWPF